MSGLPPRLLLLQRGCPALLSHAPQYVRVKEAHGPAPTIDSHVYPEARGRAHLRSLEACLARPSAPQSAAAACSATSAASLGGVHSAPSVPRRPGSSHQEAGRSSLVTPGAAVPRHWGDRGRGAGVGWGKGARCCRIAGATSFTFATGLHNHSHNHSDSSAFAFGYHTRARSTVQQSPHLARACVVHAHRAAPPRTAPPRPAPRTRICDACRYARWPHAPLQLKRQRSRRQLAPAR